MTDSEKNENNESTSPQGEGVSFIPASAVKNSNMPVRRQLAIVGLLLAGIFGFGASAVWLQERGDDSIVPNSVVQTVPESDIKTSDEKITFDSLEILAQGAIVVDLNTDKILYQKSAGEPLPLASITKLMTALVASEVIEDGAIVSISQSAIDQAGESGLKVGEQFSYQSLSDLVLLTSSNDGAYALSAYVGGSFDPDSPDEAFVKAMNVRAKELGLSQTSFRNPTGLDISITEAGAYGSARDVATLLEYIIETSPALLESTTYTGANIYSTGGALHIADNTNYVVDAIPHAIASKTGYTTLAGGNLVVAFEVGLNRPVIVVVLGSTHQGRFSDMLKLVEATRSEIKSTI